MPIYIWFTRFIYYFDKSIKTCFAIFVFKDLTRAYLVKTFMTHNHYLTILFFEDNYPISSKSAVQILSLNLK